MSLCEDAPCCGCCPKDVVLAVECDCGGAGCNDCGDHADICCDCEDCDGECGDAPDMNDSMDGDHDSAMASVGWGTDEDCGSYGGDDF